MADPKFIDEHRKIMQKHPIASDGIKTMSVAAQWNHLPFVDNSFKRIVSHYAFPLWCKSRQELVETIRELKRVLDYGGEIRFQDCTNFSFNNNDIAKSGRDFYNYFLELLHAERLVTNEVPAGSMAGKMGVEMALSVVKPNKTNNKCG